MKLISTIKFLFLAATTSLLLASCLGDKESEKVVTNYYNSIVTAFSLSDDADIASNLSKYEFTIDNYGTSDAAIHAKFPNDGIIFNADSLPYGTIADSVKVTMSFSSPDSAYFCLYTPDGKLGQYSNVSKDSALYFASYPDARLHISSRGIRKVYHVKINVHKIAADTIKWKSVVDDPWLNATLTDQRTDTIGSTVYWFAECGGHELLTLANMNASLKEWIEPCAVKVEGDELLDLQTLYSWHQSLYATGKTTGTLYSSTDGFNWQAANSNYQFTAILGNQLATKDVYGNWNKDSLNAIVHYEDAYHFAVSADGKEWRIDKAIPRNFPVRGFTRPISVAARAYNGNLTSRLYIFGGMTADGRSLSSSVWSCDGYSETEQGCNWAEFPHGNLPAMQGASIIEYTLDSDHPKTFWILFPGFIADGTIPHETHYGRRYASLYYSEDNGVSWHNLFAKYPKMADISDFSDRVASTALCNQKDFQIYLFGGKKEDGTFSAQLLSGQLPSLTFTKVR